jgi:hypothetical protein
MAHDYKHLPQNVAGWREIVESAKDAYWLARRDGRSETDALLRALDMAIGMTENAKATTSNG